MSESCTEDRTTLRERICDLARADVIHDINNRMHDRMSQAETLDEFLTGVDDKIDDEVFNMYETYLRRIQNSVKNMPVNL